MSDIVRFEFGEPVEVALQFPEPKVFDGQYGERHMYSLTDGRVMYVDPLTAARIKSLGVQPGEFFFIRKDKNERRTEWSVYREADQAPAPPARRSLPPHELARRLPEIVAARNAGASLEEQLAASIDMVERRKTAARAEEPAPAAMRQSWQTVLLAQTNALTDVYAAALAYASEKHGNAVKPEDIRNMMTTAFISLSKKDNSRAA